MAQPASDLRFAKRRLPLKSAWLLTLTGIALLVTACGASDSNSATTYHTPTGWHDVTPPTTQSIAAYAISPDVPGLIVACIGDKTAHVSAAPMGLATLWRTRDGGAHWSHLPAMQFSAGCELAFPSGGHGTLFALNLYGDGAIRFSHDAGDTWKTVATGSGTSSDGIQQLFAALAGGVYRDGLLYVATASQAANAEAALVSTFSMSSNDGATLTALGAGSDPLAHQGFLPLAIAADYRSPNAWFRLLGSPAGNNPPPSPAVLEHSTDGGHTWSVVGPVGPTGSFSYYGNATLATTPLHPGRLCAGISAEVWLQAAATKTSAPLAYGSAVHTGNTLGPPAPEPRDVALVATDDGGTTWSSATVDKHRRDYGRAVQPGVSIAPDGRCFLADEKSEFGDGTANVTTLWEVTTTALAGPQIVTKITGQAVNAFGVSYGSDGQFLRFIAVTQTATESKPCTSSPCTFSITGNTPHLIWSDVP